MKNGGNYNGGRRKFLKGVGAAMLLAQVLPLAQACKKKFAAMVVRMTGTNHVLGHRLWAKNFPKPSGKIAVKYLIVGGGVTGLSAARQLVKKGIDDFLLLEMESHTGGNASSGENKYSKYPLGAHYLPLPNVHDKELLAFLEEEKIITGYDHEGFPVFDGEQLTFSPQERLFFNNSWQEGLIPKFGLPDGVDGEFERFFKLMDDYRKAKGSDGKYFFDIPLSFVSSDTSYRVFDNITMEQWLIDNHFRTGYLKEYLDYCCRDDYGLGVAYVSAWAGIHYFAGRKHNSGAQYHDNVLTWPEGNARLASHLAKYSKNKVRKSCLVFDIREEGGKVTVSAYDAEKKEAFLVEAEKVIVTSPQFVNQYLIPGRKRYLISFNYAPWLLATLTIRDIPDDEGYPLCWDNVIFGAKGLGYIYNQHQSVGQLQEKKVITYYHSLSGPDCRKARKAMYREKEDYWKNLVLEDLKIAHPLIHVEVEEINIHRLGHGMISPTPGFLFGQDKVDAARPIGGKIYFAHSDLSGISIFEEAFHRGIDVINRITNEAALDT